MTVTVDTNADVKFAAHIDSVQRGSGARFSLLPPENATGNYVKVVQRVPVKIVFDDLKQIKQYGLGPGMSVVPTVNIDAPGRQLPRLPRSPHLAEISSTTSCSRIAAHGAAASQATGLSSSPSSQPEYVADDCCNRRTDRLEAQRESVADCRSRHAGDVLEVLDTSVANVALPHIAGNLSASTDEATWVLTSYLVSNAIMLPMTGWLSSFFGRKRFLIGCIAIFTLASAACGVATELNFLILARVLQGAAGGALQPLSQSILLESFPPAKHGVAMAVFGMGVVVAPIIGPVLGGWITDNYSWRWIFYINVPIGILAILMSQAFLEEPPYLRAAHERRGGQIDYIGFGVMAIWLATLQVILDRGQQDDWFNAEWICWASGVSLASMIAFIVWELRMPHPLVNLRVMQNRNFATGTLLITIVGVVLYSTTALLPLFLQSLMGYPALNSGMAISPRGMGAVFALLMVGRLVGIIDTRVLIGAGFCLLSYSCWVFGRINLEIATMNVMWPNVLSGMATACVFVPLTTSAWGVCRTQKWATPPGFSISRETSAGALASR